MLSTFFESFTNKILIPFRLLPVDGLTSEKLALSVTIGIVSGLFPVIGATTLLSLLLTMLFRQNLLIVQSVQWLIALVQIVLIVPLMQFGSLLLNQPALHVNLTQIKLAFQPGILAGIKTLGIFQLYGIFAWAILMIPLGVASYFVFLAVFRKKKMVVCVAQDIEGKKL